MDQMDEVELATVPSKIESDIQEIIKEFLPSVNEKFELLRTLASGVATGNLQGLVVRGAAGIGKTFTVLDHLRNKHVRKSKDPIKVKHLCGHITPLQTYKTLEANRDNKSIVVFDDCDAVFTELTSLNILKAACDTGKFRRVSWNSSKADTEAFDYDGGMIIISNAEFKNDHYQAFIDRVHLYDMKVSNKEKIAKIYDTSTRIGDVRPKVAKEISEWLFSNEKYVDYLSMRTFYKIAQLTKISTEWKKLAEVTVFTNVE